MLDIVAMDGGSFIAIRDYPAAPCPGKDWQLLCKQGKSGKPERPGEKGDKGDPGRSLVSWQIDPPEISSVATLERRPGWTQFRTSRALRAV